MTRVLVVDDEPQILRALRINLLARQYRCFDGRPPAPTPCAPPSTTTPISSCSTSGCPTWTASRSPRVAVWAPVPIVVLSGR